MVLTGSATDLADSTPAKEIRPYWGRDSDGATGVLVVYLRVDDVMEDGDVTTGTGVLDVGGGDFARDLRGSLGVADDLDVSDGSDLFRVIARS
jgi:hypothetical protein